MSELPLLTPAPTCLLWDVDGTLVDTTTLITDALDHVYQKFYHRTLSLDERRAIIGTPLKKQVRVFGDPEQFGTDEQTVIEDFIVYYEAHRDRERVLDDVTALLIEGKQRGLPTGLVTSKNREELDNTLPRLGIADFIDLAITADDVAHPKPDPEGIRTALLRFGLAGDHAANACYIGDTVHDMRAAKAAGVRPIAVTWGAAPRHSLEDEQPVALCDTPTTLRQLLFQAGVSS